jgi:hypothetical protein
LSVITRTPEPDAAEAAPPGQAGDAATPIAGRRRVAEWLPAVGPPILALLLALAAIDVLFGDVHTNFEEVALGSETTTVFARVGGAPIHCMDLRDVDGCLAGVRARSPSRVALWLGNSQLHAINQYEAGERTAPALVHDRLAGEGLDLLTLSPPNANLQEHFALFEYVRARVPLGLVIVPVVFDDLREDGLRATVAAALSDPATRAALEQRPEGAELVRRYDLAPAESEDLAGVAETVQERSEKFLNGWLADHSKLWDARPEVRGALFRGIYLVRNSLFQIDAQSTRHVIPARRDRNLGALRGIIASAAAAGITPVVYVVPLRNDVAIPYDLAEYARFKSDVSEIAREGGARFADLEALVPAGYWGRTLGGGVSGGTEIDFMHFQAPGHALLAEAVLGLVRDEPSGAKR